MRCRFTAFSVSILTVAVAVGAPLPSYAGVVFNDTFGSGLVQWWTGSVDSLGNTGNGLADIGVTPAGLVFAPSVTLGNDYLVDWAIPDLSGALGPGQYTMSFDLTDALSQDGTDYFVAALYSVPNADIHANAYDFLVPDAGLIVFQSGYATQGVTAQVTGDPASGNPAHFALTFDVAGYTVPVLMALDSSPELTGQVTLDNFSITTSAIVPEPASLTLLGCGFAMMAVRALRRK